MSYIKNTKPSITVEKINSDLYKVEVNHNSSTVHIVSLSPTTYSEISKNIITPEKLIYVSFIFLMERESNESILSNFNLEIIQNYFPEYLSKIKNYF
ncbi:hypothetical protein OAL85_04510 [Methylophilaceae bacterium]|jgi:hypothetical protein|nr:hypothetical protein [Methylophilaceae bacterium]